MIGYAAPDLATLDHIESLLEGYGNARLRPSAAALARMRSAVIADARVVRRRWAIDVPKASKAARTVAFGLHRPRPRAGAFAVGFAAVLTIALSAAVLAAQPGSPLYPARQYLETLAAELTPRDASSSPVEPAVSAGQGAVSNPGGKAGNGNGGGKGGGAGNGNGNGGNGQGAGVGGGNGGGGGGGDGGGGAGSGNGSTGGGNGGGADTDDEANDAETWDWDNIDWNDIDWDQVDWDWSSIDWDQVDWDWDDLDWEWD